MFYKIKYILFIFSLSFAFSQANFNRLLGEDIFYGDARSMAIGNSFMTTGTTGNLILHNPSKIASLRNNFILHTQFNGRFNNERKGIVVKDFFDDVITEADYVFNQNTYYNTSFSLLVNRPINKFVNFGFAYMHAPYLSFDYYYKEEVRGDSDAPDNFIGSSDPLVGFQILESNGKTKIHSLGFSVSLDYLENREISIGLGLNKIDPFNLTDYCYADTVNVTEDLSNLANIAPFINIFEVKPEKKHFLSYSFTIPILEDLNVVYSYEEDIDISSVNYIDYQLSPYIGLPILMDFNTSNQLRYQILGLHYNKPEKNSIGIIYKPQSSNSLLVSFEAINKSKKHYLSEWSCYDIIGAQVICDGNEDTSVLYDIVKEEKLHEFKLGFEHFMNYGFPIRAGFHYIEQPFNFDAVSIFTMGTGKNFNTNIGANGSLDFAINYKMNSYRYYDIFPVQTDIFDNVCSDDVKCNNVKESQLSFLTTIKIGF